MPLIRSLSSRVAVWQRIVRTFSAEAARQKDLRSRAWMRACRPLFTAVLGSARLHGLISPWEAPVIDAALESWEEADLAMRQAVLALVTDIHRLMGRQDELASDLLGSFLDLYIQAVGIMAALEPLARMELDALVSGGSPPPANRRTPTRLRKPTRTAVSAE
jgi:hypothetical protein